jgi:uncharacterized membrane protein YdjX (TVP38/TMEM64 family)
MVQGRDIAARRDPAEPSPVRPRSRRRSFILLAMVAAVALAILATGAHRTLSIDGLIDHRAALLATVEQHPVLAIVGAAILYAVAVALSIPGALVLTVACGFLFGALTGGVVAAFSATSGATAFFLVARGSLGETLRRRAGPRLTRFASGFRDDAFSYLLFLRLIPVAPFWLVNLSAALLGVSTRVFVGATAIGILPATFAFAMIGAGLDSVIAAHQAARASCVGLDCADGLAPGAVLTPGLLAGLAALAALSLLPVAVRLARRQRRW